MSGQLSLLNDTPTKKAILDFVAKVTDQNNTSYVPPDERVAVFDNDGTLWSEKPLQPRLTLSCGGCHDSLYLGGDS
jgi:hypothetical protein